LGILYFGSNYLKGFGLFVQGHSYVAVYERVDGLSEASPLFLNGYKVGQVASTKMIHQGSDVGKIAVTFQITEKELFVPNDAEIQIFSADLFTKAARFDIGTSTISAQSGDTLEGSSQLSVTEMFSQELDPIKRRAETLMASVDTVLGAFQKIMDEGTQSDIAVSFATIRSSLESFSNTAARLDKLIQRESPAIENSLDNFADISDTLNSHTQDMGKIISNMAAISDTLANGGIADLMGSLGETSIRMESILNKIDQGEGSLGLFININRAAEELAVLLDDFEKHPERYVQVSVFGRKNKKPAISDKDIDDIKSRLNCCP